MYELLRLVDGDVPVIGKLYYRMFEIQEKINNNQSLTVPQRQEIYEPFVSRWTMLHTNMHAAGFLLDPEYVNMAQHANQEVMTGFYELVEKMFPDTQQQVLIAAQLAQFRSRQGLFGRPVAKAAANSLPAYQWWVSFGACVPELQSFAIRVLSQTSSSSDAERNWSLFGFLQNKRRNQLKPKTIEKMVHIHANDRLLDKISDVDYHETNVEWNDECSSADSSSDASDTESDTEQNSDAHE